jgi:hypothetical protein
MIILRFPMAGICLRSGGGVFEVLEVFLRGML